MASLMKWTQNPMDTLEHLFNEDLHLLPLIKNQNDLALDMYEEKEALVVEMNAAGMDSDCFHISVEGNHLRVAAEVDKQEESKERRYVVRQRKQHSFERLITLPCDVQSEATFAQYKEGVLKITLPKKLALRASRIEVKKG